MIIPGSDLLGLALSVISRQAFQYRAFELRATNNYGQDVTLYAPLVDASGSVQPVPRNLYQALGLDFQKQYFNFFLKKDIIDVARDVSGDQFIFRGKCYQCLSKTDWFGVDGWDQVLCVEVPYFNNAPGLNWGLDRFHQNYDNGNFTNT